MLANGFEDDKKKKKRGKKGKKTEIRADRQIAITADGGWNTVGANGIMTTYYVNPRIGVDLGFGTGLKGFKVGGRGKYMLSTKNFAPFLGLGISGRFLNEENVSTTLEVIDDNGLTTLETYVYDINRVLYIQPAVGFEYMSDGGFVIGLATGYTIAANDPITFISEPNEAFEIGTNLIWGNGIIFSLNIGYAF
jgi:hypothetical protein